MSIPVSPNGTFDFLVKLRKIDKRGLTVRDILVLYAIIQQPGTMGLDISTKLGLADRSAIASCLQRLEREGYIVDHREVRSKAVPAVLHPLPKGLEFWEEIKPE